MKKKESKQETVVLTSPSLRAKVGAAAISGCLVLAMAPAVALANPPEGSDIQRQQDMAEGMRSQFGDGQETVQDMRQMPNMPGAPDAEGLGGVGQTPTDRQDVQPDPQAGQSAQAQRNGVILAPTQEEGQQEGEGQARPTTPDGTTDAKPLNDGSGNSASSDGAKNEPAPAPQNAPSNADSKTAPKRVDNERAATTVAPRQNNKEIDDTIIDAIDDEGVAALAKRGNIDTDNKRPAVAGRKVSQRLVPEIL